jgi:putative redox protein
MAAPQDSASPAQEKPPAKVRVEIDAASGLTTRILAGPHELTADEPTIVPGGHDRGPNPYSLLLAALGSCTAMTLRLYAERKGWPLEAVRVDLAHGRIHARDCADCTSEGGLIDRIQVQLELIGPLDAAQRARLEEIAGRCPVHRTLTREMRIEIHPLEGPG